MSNDSSDQAIHLSTFELNSVPGLIDGKLGKHFTACKQIQILSRQWNVRYVNNKDYSIMTLTRLEMNKQTDFLHLIG